MYNNQHPRLGVTQLMGYRLGPGFGGGIDAASFTALFDNKVAVINGTLDASGELSIIDTTVDFNNVNRLSYHPDPAAALPSDATLYHEVVSPTELKVISADGSAWAGVAIKGLYVRP